MRPEIVGRIRETSAIRYPHASVTRAVPNRETLRYDEVPQ